MGQFEKYTEHRYGRVIAVYKIYAEDYNQFDMLIGFLTYLDFIADVSEIKRDLLKKAVIRHLEKLSMREIGHKDVWKMVPESAYVMDVLEGIR